MTEQPHVALGVPGVMVKVEQTSGKLFEHQYFTATRPTGRDAEMINVCLEFDDFCKNGYQVFTIRGVALPERRGCHSDEIIAVFPEFAHLVKWHNCSTNGPWGYIDSTIYLAGERDHLGLRKGEVRQRTDENGAPLWELRSSVLLVRVSHRKPIAIPVPRFSRSEIVGEGKARDLDAARRVAVWPDATDEELMQEPEALKAALLARLPKLLAEFRRDMEALGFEWRVTNNALWWREGVGQ